MLKIQIPKTIKDEAESILSSIGIEPSQAINMFYRQIVIQHKLPFDLVGVVNNTPNQITENVMDDVEKGVNIVEFDTIDDAFEDLGIK